MKCAEFKGISDYKRTHLHLLHVHSSNIKEPQRLAIALSCPTDTSTMY